MSSRLYRVLCATALVGVALPPATARGQAARVLEREHQLELAKLQPKINEAIDKGVAFLLARQDRDGSWNDEPRFATGRTALCTYTLMKSGLLADHAAVLRGLEFIRQTRPVMVYAAGCQLLALRTAASSSDIERIADLAGRLLTWQEGSWGYPNPNETGHVAGLHTDRDLSITQFALFGLRAARQAGAKVPQAAWVRAAEQVLRYQAKARPSPGRIPRTGRPSRGESAGFRYKWSSPGEASTGSMTTAGVASLAIIQQALSPKLRKVWNRRVDRGIERGCAWLDENWSVTKNPGKADWLYYYLYGLERVGSLLGREYVGEHPWYLEGARELLKLQKKNGSWSKSRIEAETCFALLFLSRATGPSTGKAARKPHSIVAEAEDAEVGLRAIGGADGLPVRMWITRLGLPDKPVPELVRQVDYLIDGTVVASVPGDPSRKRRVGEAYLATPAFERRGTYELVARVHLVEPLSRPDEEPRERTLSSKKVNLVVDHILEPWMLDAASADSRNLLRGVRVSARTSTKHGNNSGANAVDGRQSTTWVATTADEEPTLSLQLGVARRASHIVLSTANGQRSKLGQHERIVQVAITVNNSKPFVAELAADEMEPTVIALPRKMRVRKLIITVTERDRGKKKRHCGFAEVSLELRKD